MHSSHPMLDVKFFENPRFSAASVGIMLVFFALFGTTFLLTQYFQFVLGYTPLQTGVRLLPLALVLMVVAPLSARVNEKVGTKITVSVGLFVVAAGLALLSQVSTRTGYGDLVWRMMLMAVGMALAMTPATDSIMGALPREKAGVGSAVNDTSRELGGALGIAILGSIANTAYRSGIDLSRVRLPAGTRVAAEGSIGAADSIARRIPGGEALAAQAASAFTDAFKLVAWISVGIALAAAAVILFVWRRRREPVTEGIEQEAAEVGVDLARLPVRPCP
jgi:Na+/melibiose symporter-like transporter